MQKFTNFDLLPILEHLLLESKLEFSKEFSQVLYLMGDNKFSQVLLGAFRSGEDKDYSLNYVDITDKDDYLEYIPQSKADRLLSSPIYKIRNISNLLSFNKVGDRYKNQPMFDELGFDPSLEPNLDKPSRGQLCKIISRHQSSRSSKEYALIELLDSTTLRPIGSKRVINVEGLEEYIRPDTRPWKEQRSEFRVAKLAKSILNTLNVNYTEPEVADFAQKYKAAWESFRSGFMKFDVVEGSKIAFWYKSSNYYRNTGTIGNSCMKEKDSDYFKIYSENPEVCKMVILYDDFGSVTNGKYTSSRIVGRAILWTLKDGRIFMDRIYGTEDAVIDKFKNFASSQGWFYKKYQDRSTDTYITGPDGRNVTQKLRVQAKKCTFLKYPYMDTLCFVDRSANIITNGPEIGMISCRSTGGGFDNISS
jgi:hypothetical protein